MKRYRDIRLGTDKEEQPQEEIAPQEEILDEEAPLDEADEIILNEDDTQE